MLKTVKTSNLEVLSVRGTPAEMMLFYCIWETHLWSDWLDYTKLGDPKDAVARQHRNVIKSINDGRDFLISNSEKMFQDALDFAIERCKMLGIEVEND